MEVKIDNIGKRILIVLNTNEKITLGKLKHRLSSFVNIDEYELIIKEGV